MGNFAVKLNVLRNGKTGQEHKFLVHHANSLYHGVVRRGDLGVFSIKKHRSLKAAGAVDDGHAKKNVHERGLTGAVFTQQRVYFAGTHGQGDIVQNGVFAIALGDVFHF